MKTLKRTNDRIKGFASLANIGYRMYEVNLEGEVYKRARSRRSMRYKADRVGDNRWKIYTRDSSGRLIEQVMRTDVLVGCAWCSVDEKIWENSTYADIIRRCKEFFSISDLDKAKTDYKTKNGFSYYVTKFGEVWNTEKMIKIKGCISSSGYCRVALGSERNIIVHRLVAYHFVSIPKYLSDQELSKENLEVNHIDGNKLNNRCDNLEWVTHKGNLVHASSTGLLHTTIDDHKLERVQQLLQAGYSDINISKITGVPVRTVSNIRHGKSSRYITDKYTWSKYSVDVHEKERRDELAIKCVTLFNQGMSYQAIADKLGFKSRITIATLIGTRKDLITRKLPRKPAQRTKLDRDTIFSIYDDFIYTNMSNSEIARKYNVSSRAIYDLRIGKRHADLAREYITSKGLAGYRQGFSPPK